MKPVDQKKFPSTGTMNGDCWIAAIASILECDESEFPFWDINTSFNDYAASVVQIIHDKFHFYYYELPINQVKENDLLCESTCGYCVAIGTSPRDPERKHFDHAVVWKNGIAHDPHPDKTGILTITYFGIFERI